MMFLDDIAFASSLSLHILLYEKLRAYLPSVGTDKLCPAGAKRTEICDSAVAHH